MKVLIEGVTYPITELQSVFGDESFYLQDGSNGIITSVGYYHSFEKNELVYMLPKVYMKDEVTTVFGITVAELLNINGITGLKHEKNYSWIRQSTVFFYNSLLEYRRRISTSQIVKTAESSDLNTNIGSNEYSYLDLLLSFVNFYKKHKTSIITKHISSISSHARKTKWEKTIRNSIPLITEDFSPVYVSLTNRKRVADSEEQLIVYFFSILDSFNKEHGLSIKIDKSINIIKGSKFEKLKLTGLSKLRKIKYRFFSDQLKRMYLLCELYFSKHNRAGLKKKKHDFLIVSNYNLVFEDMVDKLFSDEYANSQSDEVTINSLKKNDDGKIIDHIYRYQSLIDTSNIYYIGDSKYYKSNAEAGKLSKYKQFTYAKNIIQFNIESLNKGPTRPIKSGTRYRDELTEGYNITPNFFVYGFVDRVDNFNDHLIKQKSKVPVRSAHYPHRLFDRDTLFVHQYKINFLYVLKAYTCFDRIKLQSFKGEIKSTFRKHFIEFFNSPQICQFNFFIHKEKEQQKHEKLVNPNFKELNGKCYVTVDNHLILAVHVEDEIASSILEEFEPMSSLY